MDPVMAHILESTYLDVMVEERRRDLQATNLRALTGKWKVGDIRKNILDQADIVCCTLSGAGSQPVLEVVLRITGFKFDAVIIDEAAQATEPLSLIPFKYNPKVVVMVGDPCQLPAIVFSSKAKNCNYDQSLFQRLQRLGHPVSMLETQYRMHPDIAQYSSARFYNNFLKTDSNILLSSSHVKPYHVHESGRYRPIVFHNIAYGVEFVTGSSIQNAEEAKYVLLLHKDLVKHYPEHAKDIGIIAPYQAQRKLLMSMFKSCVEPIDADAVEISTIDGFQGREKGIIILSCVRSARRSKGRGGIGFLQDWQRLNVAITRAKYSLWIVGNAETLQNHQEWATLIKYIKQDKRNFITHSRPPLSIGEKIPTVPVNNNFSRQNNSRLRDRQRRDDRRSNSRGNRDNRNFESRDGKGKSDRMQSIDRRNSRSKYEQPSDTSMKDVIANDPVAPGVAATTYSPSYRKPSENQQTNGTSSASAPLPPASIPHSNVDSHVELYNGDSRRIDRFKPTVRPPTPNVPSLAQPSHKRFNDVSSDVQSANRFARKYNFNGYDTKRHRHF